MNACEVLVKARGIISDPIKWTKGTRRRRIGIGNLAGLDQFCALGALDFAATGTVYPTSAPLALRIAQDKLAEQCPKTNPVTGNPYVYRSDQVIYFNDADEVTHDDILGAFDRAIEACESELPAS